MSDLDLVILGGGALLVIMFCFWIWIEYKRDTER